MLRVCPYFIVCGRKSCNNYVPRKTNAKLVWCYNFPKGAEIPLSIDVPASIHPLPGGTLIELTDIEDGSQA